MPDKTKQQRFRSALPVILAVVPPIFTGLAIYVYAVDSPLWDEWLIGGYLYEYSQGTLSFRDLFAQQNEYRQFFPNLIFVALGWLGRWDVRWWMAASFVMAGIVSFCTYRLGRWSLSETPRRATWIWFIANLIIFSPVQHENWLQGQQLVYFLPIACFAASLLVAATARLRLVFKFLLCAGLSVVASFSSVNGMLCWILLLPVLAWPSSPTQLSRRSLLIGLWLAGFAATIALYFNDYHRPVQHDPFALLRTNPSEIFFYYLATLGRSLAPGRRVIATIVGFGLLILFLWSCWRFVKALRSSADLARPFLPWLMLGAYSIITAALLTIGRLEHDATRALAPSRYTTFTIFLPVALVYLIPIILAQHPRQLGLFSFRLSSSSVLKASAVSLIVLHLAIYTLGIRQMHSFRTNALQAKACSLLVNVVEDKCLVEQVFPNLEILKRNINQADRLGFIRPGLIKTNRAQEIAVSQLPGSNSVGAFQNLAAAGDGNYLASGWAKLPERAESADVVLLAYSEEDGSEIIFAVAPVTRRDPVSNIIRRTVDGDATWSKSFSPARIPSEGAKLTAWAFDALSGKAYKLEGEHAFQNRSGSKLINAQIGSSR